MRKLIVGPLVALLATTLGWQIDAQQVTCDDGRLPSTEIGARHQLAQQVMTLTTRNPFALVDASGVRYLRARITANSLGKGDWYLTVRDLSGHPLQTFSRDDFAVSANRWTGRIPGSSTTLDLRMNGGTSPELEITEYIAMPADKTNSYYSVKTIGQQQWRALYNSQTAVIDEQFRPWGDVAAFLMTSWSTMVWGCSGIVVGPKLLLTAWHCGGVGTMPEAAFWNQDICSDALIDLSWDDNMSSRDFGCARVIDKDKDLDFALLEMDSTSQLGRARPAVLNLRPLADSADLVVIHHPSYLQKQLTTDCRVASSSVSGWTNKPDYDFSHDCDTEKGSSGAPIFNAAGEVVGLHHYGHEVDLKTCMDTDHVNKAVRIDKIVSFLANRRTLNGNVVEKLSVVR